MRIAGSSVRKYPITLSLCLSVVVACADHPQTARPLTAPCHATDVYSGGQIAAASSQKLPPSKIFKLGYFYPENLASQHLQGRVLVRLRVAETGKIDSAEFLSIEASPQVQAQMCNLLRKLQYDVSKPDFETIESRTFVLGIRYCLGNCSRVPVYPGFEKTEIAITGSQRP